MYIYIYSARNFVHTLVQVNYKPDDSAFTADNLQVMVKFNGNTTVWSPYPTFNRTLDGNLMGTIRVSKHSAQVN